MYVPSCYVIGHYGQRFVDVEVEGEDRRLDLTGFAMPEPQRELVFEDEIVVTPQLKGKEEWSDKSTKLFLDLYPKFDKLVQTRKVASYEKMWPLMLKEFKAKGYHFVEKQLRTKYHSLERAWKNKTVQSHKTGRGRQDLPYAKYEYILHLNNLYISH
jgi:hypothetical protein